MMFCDLNFGTNSTLGLKSTPARSKLQRNWAASWDNWWSESIRLIPIRPSHPNESPRAAEDPARLISRGASACVSPPAILSGAFGREAQQTLCDPIRQGVRELSGKLLGQWGQTDSSRKGERFPCRNPKDRKQSISHRCESILPFQWQSAKSGQRDLHKNFMLPLGIFCCLV